MKQNAYSYSIMQYGIVFWVWDASVSLHIDIQITAEVHSHDTIAAILNWGL